MLMRCWPMNPYCMQIMFNSQFENENPQIEYYVENSNFIIHLSARLNVYHNQLLQKQFFPLQTLNCLCFFSSFAYFKIKFNFKLICSLCPFFCACWTFSFLVCFFFLGSINWIMCVLWNLIETFVPFAGERIPIESFW